MSEPSIFEEIEQLVREYTQAFRVIEERRARAAAQRWLCPRLRWLVNYPRLMKWYIRLPHKKILVAVYKRDEKGIHGFADFELMPKKDLR